MASLFTQFRSYDHLASLMVAAIRQMEDSGRRVVLQASSLVVAASLFLPTKLMRSRLESVVNHTLRYNRSQLRHL